MKLVTKVTTLVAAIASFAMLASCGSTEEASSAAAAAPAAAVEKPARAETIPTFEFTGDKLVIQIEDMLYDEMLIFPDATATNGWGAKLLGVDSFAECMVKFPAGTYEGLASEDAPDGNHDAFNCIVNDVYYRTFPSDPPIGTYELTTRTPMKIVFDKETTCKVRVQQNDPNKPNKPGENGMKLDFIQFTKK